MYTADTLPADRQNFFANRVPPLNGISRFDWYPTDEEFVIVYNVLSSELAASSDDLDEVDFYCWLMDNFLGPDYTDNYTNEVSEEMVLAAISSYRSEL